MQRKAQIFKRGSHINNKKITKNNFLKVALAKISPVWLNKQKSIEKIEKSIADAAKESCRLIVFGEAFLLGYPFWIALTNGAEWASKT